MVLNSSIELLCVMSSGREFIVWVLKKEKNLWPYLTSLTGGAFSKIQLELPSYPNFIK